MTQEGKASGNAMNPRYVAYAEAHGKTPEAMLEFDRKAWPGGCMTGFIRWIDAHKRAFWRVRPEAFLDRYTILDQEAFSAFLREVAKRGPGAAAR